jgi:hypothetical protein
MQPHQEESKGEVPVREYRGRRLVLSPLRLAWDVEERGRITLTTAQTHRPATV